MSAKVVIEKLPGVYVLHSKQLIQADLESVWTYFSRPQNLEKITPNDLTFEITSQPDEIMYPGQLISYRIGIFPFIKSNWITEISQVREREYFIDEQRFGPYRFWHHTHKFTSTAKGIQMEDQVFFKLPFGLFGKMAYALFIKKKLTKIFEFRYKHVDSVFHTTS